ncbi:MAG: (d)CMP kinase [Gammaproteobacteria bacterium]|jgi:cytidylate kinase
MNSIPVITIDGPVGAGKGTIAQALAKKLGWHLLDSGAIYRILALSVLQNQIDPNDEIAVAALVVNLNIKFKPSLQDNVPCQVMLENQDVTDQIRTEDVGKTASIIAAYPKVRQALLQLQRTFRKPPGLIADGRDMGTVVFTDAPLKIFLTASVAERAKRRHQQLLDKGISVKLPDLVQEITGRDARDEQRAASPLKPADDAIIIDTTDLTIKEVIKEILGLMK